MKNVKFVEGDSTRLNEVKELKEDSLDLVFNIESSHCYNDLEGFFSGVNRLLKPDGTFVYVDWRFSEMIPDMEEALKRNFTIEKYEDISENVISALKASSEYKYKLVASRHVPLYCRKIIVDFLGVENSTIHNRLRDK
mmetsp:Transcript_43911/g.42435  ORF Transcript_43911/g.42435 Transcript_43911/m.42435 type:complete len:138 (+) Transcript_43911:595-1008(+)|eukprot:CAMPEP_0170541574 /NCGR_PEP_ID=MMETSP0211-20121228/1274_1 /TAXON_ID=311385 /ORGANISM="Pseudokeronopsis sp., Strain OXSARD2" /LENGTH=137 /DNA_ID=CAMNT_0010844359 /DNA_START=582 /DNA_END=995 /DNA_ORIENTATION=-